jgi:hypothetical protein
MKGLVGTTLKKKVCYVCGRVGELLENRGKYKGLELFRCFNNNFCTDKLIKGYNKEVKLIYTNQGVIKYQKKASKEEQPIFLNQEELAELKQVELKERQAQLQDPKYKPTLIEFFTLALQEKYYSVEELAVKFKANLSTVKSTIPYQIKKQGYNVINIMGEDKVLRYKIEDKMGELKRETGVPTMSVVDKATAVNVNPPQIKVEQPKVKKPYVMTIPKSGLVFNMFELLKTGEFTIKELMEKVGVAEATCKMQLNYHIKNKTINIVQNGDKYSIK